ncbi:hypothetical protein N431DRAFT_246263 [Stipitochalara longipes BDJ]|nr:hypothetical protein N431DRAFT_246263 [Stipitochalara longipes BDJ]
MGIWQLIQDIKRKESVAVRICVTKKVFAQAGFQFINQQNVDQDIDSLVQFWSTYEREYEGNGVWVQDKDAGEVELVSLNSQKAFYRHLLTMATSKVWDSYVSNHLLLENLITRDTLEKAGVPPVQIGLNSNNTGGIVAKKVESGGLRFAIQRKSMQPCYSELGKRQ